MRIRSSRRDFSFEVSRIAGRVVVTGHGTLDSSACPVLDRALRDLIDNQGNMAVVVDLADVTVSDLECTSVLLAAAASAACRGGELTLAAPPAAVRWAVEAADAPGGIAVTGQIAPTSKIARTP
jgi:anti-anti-sigma regulatory factor